MSSLSASAARVQAALEAAGLDLQVVELPASTRTAREAAAAIGCKVEQIAKSLVFKRVDCDEGVLVITSGSNRVDEARVGEAVGGPIERAKPAFVRAQTGFAIGGVPPVGHLEPLVTFIDSDLLELPVIWAAAGTPHAVVSLRPHELVRVTRGRVLSVAVAPGR